MDCDDVTPEQAKRLLAWIEPIALRLERLHDRMTGRGFAHADPLMIRARGACQAVKSLRLALHELATKKPGRIKPPEEPEMPAWLWRRREAKGISRRRKGAG